MLFLCVSATYIHRHTKRCGICVCAHWSREERQKRRCVEERKKRRELGWKETLVLLLLSECQVIYFVIPSHIYSAEEEHERERGRGRKREKSILLWKTPCRYVSITVLYQQQQQSHRPLLLFLLLLLFCSVLLLTLPCTYARSRDPFSNRRSSSFSSYV